MPDLRKRMNEIGIRCFSEIRPRGSSPELPLAECDPHGTETPGSGIEPGRMVMLTIVSTGEVPASIELAKSTTGGGNPQADLIIKRGSVILARHSIKELLKTSDQSLIKAFPASGITAYDRIRKQRKYSLHVEKSGDTEIRINNAVFAVIPI